MYIICDLLFSFYSDGACNRLRALNHRYPSPFQLSRSHTNNNNNTATSNTNNNKHQSQLSLRHPQQYPHHHHHHHHQHGPSASNPNEPTGLQCTSPKSSSYPIAFHQGLQQQQQQQQQLQHSNPFCRSPSGLGGSSGVTGGSHIQHYPTGNIPINPPTSGTANLLIPNITTTTPTTTTTATTTTNNNNLSSIQTSGEKTIQQSFDYNSNNNKLQQQQKHQRRLGRRGTSSRPFTSDKTKSYHTGSGGPGGVGVSSTGVGGVQQVNKSSKSNNRSYSMAEHDPKGFAQILTEKLQRLLENQLVTERLDSLMTEVSVNHFVLYAFPLFCMLSFFLSVCYNPGGILIWLCVCEALTRLKRTCCLTWESLASACSHEAPNSDFFGWETGVAPSRGRRVRSVIYFW
ncbi:unnamed protein product [Trichobilharzia regenti]|nr:unnamed protein product [Trichobilharzia regenti]